LYCIRNGLIQDGGVNDIPRSFWPGFGVKMKMHESYIVVYGFLCDYAEITKNLDVDSIASEMTPMASFQENAMQSVWL
jgi:hypothetical protein